MELFFQEPFLSRRIEEHKHYSKCCDLYNKLLGNIKKYNLHPILDWGETYITGFDVNSIRIYHYYLENNENDIMFQLMMKILKEDKLNEILKEYVTDDEFYNRINIIDLTPNELKNILFKIFGY